MAHFCELHLPLVYTLFFTVTVEMKLLYTFLAACYQQRYLDVVMKLSYDHMGCRYLLMKIQKQQEWYYLPQTGDTFWGTVQYIVLSIQMIVVAHSTLLCKYLNWQYCTVFARKWWFQVTIIVPIIASPVIQRVVLVNHD